ncbi:hypothetical protein AGR1A_Lc40256 [Agrobacterium fabacearum CFBP 5771]|nr:hypothetical protein AGR1A_Lc40256 [Agrobacterium fabacearum CFBP 5771]
MLLKKVPSVLNHPFSIAGPTHSLSRRKAVDLTANDPRSSRHFNGSTASIDFFEKATTHIISPNRGP